MSDNQEINKKGFLKRLMDGDFGLAKTYWLYGVLVNIVISLMFEIPVISESLGLILILLLATIIYTISLMIGIWKAANRYTGKKVWAFLAKIAVVLGVIQMAVLVIGLVTL